MLFNSIEFAAFFPIVTLLFFSASQRLRLWILLVSSFVFYMAFVPKYIVILIVLILIDYFAGFWIEQAPREKKRHLLILSLGANLSLLFFFKYFNFVNSNLSELARFLGWRYPVENLSILLPIGLSFHTFQSLSYTIEVYRGNQKAEKDLLVYAIYVLFYPQLVAGPIERPQNLLHQFHKETNWDLNRVTSGLLLMLVGFFKKMAIADQLSVHVNKVFESPEKFSGPASMLAIYFFSIQIFCDFSGYSDIARGAARVMGYDLMQNFDRPYFSKSISEFWRRWHISLSTWFRDYLYIPFGGNTGSRLRQSLNLFIVFVVSGLWHGASWTFIVWGAIHGVLVIMSKSFHTLTKQIPSLFSKTLGTVFTFHLVTFAWVFFRAKDIIEAQKILSSGFSTLANGSLFKWLYRDSDLEVQISIALIFVLFLSQFIEFRFRVLERLYGCSLWVKAGFALVVGLVLIFFVVTNDVAAQQFIYFQF